ncbi:MAG: glycoside hydrolase family 65 protein, partial [Armatimonadetes bacterium]|nr:glycoside hydrolase family 65 protein [Candidatus Hippobium faecium]
MKKNNLLFIFILLCFGLIGCSDSVKYDKIELWKTDTKDFQNGWVMKTDFPDNRFGTYLGNGYFGMRLFSKGLCFDNNPSECYMAGVYSNENLITVPNIADIRFYEVNNSQVTEFTPTTDKNFSQYLDMKTATLFTDRVYKAGNKKIKTKIESKVLRLNDKSSRVLIKVNILPQYNGEFFVVAPVDYSKENFKFSNNSYKLIGNSKTDTLYVKQNFIINGAEKTDKYHSLKTVCMGDYDQAEQALFSVKKNNEINITYCSEISKNPIVCLLDENECNKYEEEHNKNWADLWKSDIEIEGDNEAQQTVRSNLFYLLCSASKDYSIAPMGLSHNSFSGHTFWDAEMWMFPALIWQYPQFAKGMIKYRINTLEGAIQNAENHSMKGAEYAWESGETGIETSPDPSTIYERHINGDIAFAIWEYYVFTEDKDFLKEAYPVLKNTADYWISKAEKGKNGLYEIKHICAPDENANIVDNSVYTNAIAQINLWIVTEAGKILGESVNSEYINIANNMYIGVDKTNNRFIIYD